MATIYITVCQVIKHRVSCNVIKSFQVIKVMISFLTSVVMGKSYGNHTE